MADTIQTLYDILFAELKDLRAGKVDVDHANGVANVANSMTRAIECELKFIDKVGVRGTGIVSEAHLAPRVEGPGVQVQVQVPRRVTGSVPVVNNWPRIPKDGTNQ